MGAAKYVRSVFDEALRGVVARSCRMPFVPVPTVLEQFLLDYKSSTARSGVTPPQP